MVMWANLFAVSWRTDARTFGYKCFRENDMVIRKKSILAAVLLVAFSSNVARASCSSIPSAGPVRGYQKQKNRKGKDKYAVKRKVRRVQVLRGK